MNTEKKLQDSQARKDEISFIPIIKILIKNRWIIILFTIIGLIIGISNRYFKYNKSYKATSIILLQSPQKVDSGIVFGRDKIDTMIQNATNIIITSLPTVRNIVMQQYDYEKNGKFVKTNLLEFYNNNNINEVTERVSSTIKTDYDKQKQTLTITYIASNADIASQVVNNVVAEVNKFFSVQMTSDSIRNLKFVNDQLVTAKDELNSVRLKLGQFIKNNKELNTEADKNAYPLARIELQKLQEDVQSREAFYNSLVKKSQELKIQANQVAPSVIILQKAFPPAKPLPRELLRSGVTGAFLTLIIAIIIVIFKNLSEIISVRENIFKFISDELVSDSKKLKKAFIKK